MAKPLYCRKCGTRLPIDSTFCPTCGASQTGNDQVLTTVPQQEPAIIGTGRQPAGYMLHQRYRLLHSVGQGGMGAVYVAHDTQLGDRLVAVKEMSMSRLTPQEVPQAVEQFRREAHLLASLHHPNLPVIHEYFHENDRWYLVMSFIEGQDLQSALNAAPGNRLPVNEVLRIGIELCEVLEYLHTHQPQIIFRDLKPLNIMLTPKGHICLIDFGIARHFKQEQTKDTANYYSAGYAPPEQYGQSQTGPRSDIYSLGATLHQMLSGHNPASKPFQFPNLQLVDPTIPVPLARLIAQMLEMNDQARPASVAEVKAQLEKVLKPAPHSETVPVKSGLVESKGKGRSEKTTFQQESTLTGNQIIDFWSRINNFLSKRRRVAWICFMALSLVLGSLFPVLQLIPYSLFGVGIAVTIAGVAATAVGFIFLRAKGQPLVDILGGLTLTILTLMEVGLAILSPRFYYYFYYFPYSFYSFYDSSFIYCLPFLAWLWLLVGTRFFLRSANTSGSLLWGTLLIIYLIGWGSYVVIHYGINDWIIVSWFLSLSLGIVTIVFALRKRKHNKRNISSEEVAH